MTNMIAPILSAPQLATGFVGGSGSVARAAGQHIANELGMLKLQLQKSSTVLEKEQVHGYPIWVAKRAVTLQFDATASGNFMLELLEGEATALGVGDQWAFVNAPMVANQSRKMPSLRGVMRYLVWLQGQSFTLQPSTSLHASILQSMEEWAAADLSATDFDVFRRAAKMLWGPEHFSIEQRMMHLIYWLISNSKLKLVLTPFYDVFKAGSMPSKKGVLVDQVAEKAFVNLAELRAAIRKAKLPSPNIDEAIRRALSAKQAMGFELNNDCFVVSHKYWSDELTKWRQLRL
jgi:hypothetical protein